jgi:hypothetical protein
MTRSHKNKARAKLLLSLYIWHRYIGLAAALFVIVLTVTGLLLNHTDDIGLDSIQVSSPALLDWYGIHAPANIRAFDAGTLTIAELNGQLYVNNARLPNIEGTLIGAVALDDMLLAAIGNQLVLLTRTGELVERLDDSTGVPPGMQAIGISDNGTTVIRTAQGDYQADAGLMKWSRVSAMNIRWALPATLDKTSRQQLDNAWRGNGLPLERIMLDLHSGRILGQWGVYLMDAAAILFLLLSASGVWLWARRRASARAHQRKITRRGTHQLD